MKTMKKLVASALLCGGLFSFAASAADDEDLYLYWMVNVDTTQYNYDYSVKVLAQSASAGSTYLNLYTLDSMAAPSGKVDGPSVSGSFLKTNYEGTGLGLYAGLLKNTSYSSFVIELWSDGANSSKVASSAALTSQTELYIAAADMGLPAFAPWTVNMTLPIPEPSSGLLLLLGVAGLALRRRKVQRA